MNDETYQRTYLLIKQSGSESNYTGNYASITVYYRHSGYGTTYYAPQSTSSESLPNDNSGYLRFENNKFYVKIRRGRLVNT